ncbi:MAG: aspartate kinase [Candidatus Bathyarchaeota archaeon]|nr:aspartate kinase [Candidatus Bathyarchaeota archaeon]
MREHSRRCRRIVVKFGGSSLSSHSLLSKAAAKVAKEAAKGTQIAVVVSALGKTTDKLLHTTRNSSNGKIEKKELDDILAMGERTSVRIFAAALRSNGVQSRYFDPWDQDWPILTDDSFSNANPLLERCEASVKQHVIPLLESGVIPVIAGFVGKTLDQRITTLGRGGSDATAFILANALKANEVILVTNVDGIMSADPRIVNNPERLSRIDVDTLIGLADSGTKFIHRRALRYKKSSMNVKLVNHSGDLDTAGTLITGALSTYLDVILASQQPAISITIVGHRISEKPEIVLELAKTIKSHASLLGLSLNFDSMILYASENRYHRSLLEDIHEIVRKNKETISMSVKRRLAFLKVKGVGLEQTPGVIGGISETLRMNNINIFGILTITSSILLFVDWNKKKVVQELIRTSLRRE